MTKLCFYNLTRQFTNQQIKIHLLLIQCTNHFPQFYFADKWC